MGVVEVDLLRRRVHDLQGSYMTRTAHLWTLKETLRKLLDAEHEKIPVNQERGRQLVQDLQTVECALTIQESP